MLSVYFYFLAADHDTQHLIIGLTRAEVSSRTASGVNRTVRSIGIVIGSVRYLFVSH
jgi:hypothetical protein